MLNTSLTPRDYITVGSERLPLIAQKHPRAKRITLRYDARQHAVKVTYPRHVSRIKATEFAQSKSDWLQGQLRPCNIWLTHGQHVPLLGQRVLIHYVGGRGLTYEENGILYVYGDIDFMTRRIMDYCKKMMLSALYPRLAEACDMLGVIAPTLRLRDTSSRWGSCSKKTGISLCWRLCFAPPAVLDYVLLHEVAHLKHHNHSAAFWACVVQLCPDYELHEAWLKQHGATLWHYR